MTGPAEREFERLGRKYAAASRTAVVAAASALALVVVPPPHFAFAVVVVVSLNLWSAVYCVRTALEPTGWVLAADTGVIALVCLTAPWTETPSALNNSTGWVLVAASITAVAHQWHSTPVRGLATTAVIIAAYLGGSALAAESSWTAALPIGLWTLGEAALSRGLRVVLRSAARAADRGAARGERVRREAEIAAARRADERAHLAAIHDTVAATMLAIGTGMVSGKEPWLAERAAEDLRALAGRPDAPVGEVDLVELVGRVARRSPLSVEVRADGPVPLPAAPAVALCQSVGEALANVVRHAGVESATLRLERVTGGAVVEVADQGKGFNPDLVSPHRRGLSLSIVDRMTKVGGRAAIVAAPGRGTRVRLEWCGG
ncbi:sensor histidine kinase [Amycolatopsis anabasis]|uniref:sensor histidine kinase n=1 Tax=Amycolatopsis anabasis TaxID=1840409 RepID=UPI00131E076E|nr:ATP-binding protein [Amycolatopsis anabasis]